MIISDKSTVYIYRENKLKSFQIYANKKIYVLYNIYMFCV